MGHILKSIQQDKVLFQSRLQAIGIKIVEDVIKRQVHAAHDAIQRTIVESAVYHCEREVPLALKSDLAMKNHINELEYKTSTLCGRIQKEVFQDDPHRMVLQGFKDALEKRARHILKEQQDECDKAVERAWRSTWFISVVAIITSGAAVCIDQQKRFR